MFRQPFLMMANQFGGPVIIYRAYGTAAQTQQRIPKVLKNHKQKGSKAVIFQFGDNLDIQNGDVIQEEGSRDLWSVVDTEEFRDAGEFINLDVEVVKASSSGLPNARQGLGHSVSITGNVYGALQVGSTASNQTVHVSVNPKVTDAVERLRAAVKGSDLDELDKEDVERDIERVKELAGRENTPSTVARIKEKLTAIEQAVGVSERLAVVAGPLILAIKGVFGL